ncbi:MAG: hypothetical protein ACLUUO_02660 [Sellimonas intestinalis]
MKAVFYFIGNSQMIRNGHEKDSILKRDMAFCFLLQYDCFQDIMDSVLFLTPLRLCETEKMEKPENLKTIKDE